MSLIVAECHNVYKASGAGGKDMIEKPQSALVVVPHPDDAEAWCGGTVASWSLQGTHVSYVLCTDGGKGSDDPDMTSDRLTVIRESEQLEASCVLGVEEVIMLRHPDGELEDTREFRKEIVRAIRRFRPDVVICPDPHRLNSYWHRDHRITGQVSVDAAFPYARDRLHFPELVTDEGLEPHKTGAVLFWAPDVPDTLIDITGTIDLKIKALLCHKSQIMGRSESEIGESVRERAGKFAKDSGFQFAESFRKMEFRR